MIKKLLTATYFSLPFLTFGNAIDSANNNWAWEEVDAIGKPVARHEAGLINLNENIYLLGGRRINPTSVFNVKTKKWTDLSPTPIEIHHFQPVVFDNKIYIIGAMTGQWPNEVPVEKVIIYTPQTDTYEYGDDIPKERLRGGAGTAVHNGKIYLAGGITDGHMKGFVPWLDEYNPKTGKWRSLPDAPIARDHFQLASLNNKLYAFAGRTTSKATDQDIELTIQQGNVFDIENNTWQSSSSHLNIPTERAGNSAFAWQNNIIIGGGESGTQIPAHNEIEAFNTETNQWETWPSLLTGRHGSGFVEIDGYLYIASGSGNRGGGPELTSVERLKLPEN